MDPDSDYRTCLSQKYSMDEKKEITETTGRSVVEENDGYITAQCQQNQYLTLFKGEKKMFFYISCYHHFLNCTGLEMFSLNNYISIKI